MREDWEWDEPAVREDIAQRDNYWSFAQLRHGDDFTTTVEAAAQFERARSLAFDDFPDDRPTLAECWEPGDPS